MEFQNAMRFVVVVPGNVATGGIELLYQLVDAVNANGANAYVCNHPFNKETGIPETYSDYNCPVLQRHEISNSDIVILPEVFTHLKSEFAENDVFLWWMSVDNYYGSKTLRYCAGNRLLPWRFRSITRASFKTEFKGHLCQSQYAIEHLKAHGVDTYFVVSDYINRAFVEQGQNLNTSARMNDVVYNPAKGVEQTNKLISISSLNFQPIQNMTRQEVTDLLLTSKVYVDFGNHPGKDRIPREAAALGCVVLTNRRGSAGNDLDVPIPDEFKFDDSIEGFENAVAGQIEQIVRDFDRASQKLDSYRAIIAAEKDKFHADVTAFIHRVR